jgi:protein phosphatase
MLAAYALDVKDGMSVLDCCAAPGGKTTHIAQLMNNTGSVIALDLHKHKVKLIEELVCRLGLTNVRAEALDSRKAKERFREASFDRILIDAPCSGLGVIRHKPDIKWRKSPDDINMLAVVQAEILETVAPLLKPGGKLVYSTCTIEKEENEEVVASFLKQHPQFSLDRTLVSRLPAVSHPRMNPEDGQMQILPHDFGTDGFYIAVLRKEGKKMMETAFQTDRGKIRAHNEDSGGVFQHPTGRILALVADGMGGHRAGDVASALTLEYIKDRWEGADGLDSGEAATNWLQKTIQEANTHVLSYADEHPECQGMGTTVVAALCAPEFVTIIHVGDSRCYFLGNDEFAQVTSDHSLVGELVRQGEISKEEAASHPNKHVILQALGTEETVKSDTNTIEWDVGDVVLLCSDGLTDHVRDTQLEEVLRSDKTMEEKAETLTELANQAGGGDNITLALVQLTGETDDKANHPENDSVLKNDSSPSSGQEHSQTNVDGVGESWPAEEKSR